MHPPIVQREEILEFKIRPNYKSEARTLKVDKCINLHDRNILDVKILSKACGCWNNMGDVHRQIEEKEAGLVPRILTGG